MVPALVAALLPIPTPAAAQESAQDQIVWAAGALQRILAERDYPVVLGLAAMSRALERGDAGAVEGVQELLHSLRSGAEAATVARCRGLPDPVDGTLCAVEALTPLLPAALAGDVAEEGARLVSTYFRPGETPPGAVLGAASTALGATPTLGAASGILGAALNVLSLAGTRIPAGGEGTLLAPLQSFTEGVLDDVWRLRDRIVPAAAAAALSTGQAALTGQALAGGALANEADAASGPALETLASSVAVSSLVGQVLGFSPGEAADAILPKVPELQALVLQHPALSGLHAEALDGSAMIQEYRGFLVSMGGTLRALGNDGGADALVGHAAGLIGVDALTEGITAVAAGNPADALVGALVDRTGASGLVDGFEAWATQRSFVYLSARSAALSGLDAGVTERIRTLGNAAADLKREGLAFTSNLSSLGQQAAMAVLGGNVFGVAARVASFFHLTPGALGAGASEDVRALREGVEGMRAELGAGFEQVDERFDEVIDVLDTRFDRLESLVASNHQEVREDLLSLQLGLGVLGRRMDRLESNLQTYMQAGFDRDFSRTLVRCLEHRERHLPPYDQIEFGAFSECLTDFRVRAVQDARDALLTDRTTPVDDLSLADALADLSEESLAYRLPLLARAAEQRFGYPDLLGGRGGVNATEWTVAAQAYLTMLESWPNHALAVAPGDLDALLSSGMELQRILGAIWRSPSDPASHGVLGRVMDAYEQHVDVLTAEADALARRNQQAQLLRVDPASVLDSMIPAGEAAGPALDTPPHVADAIPQELRTAAVLALEEPRLVYRTVSADSVHRDGFRRSGLFRRQRHDRHTFTRTRLEVDLLLRNGRVAATFAVAGPTVLTRVEEMGGGETSDDVRSVRHQIADVEAHFLSEVWPALTADPAAWVVGGTEDPLVREFEDAIDAELRRHETASLGEVFGAICQEGPITAVAGDADRASAIRMREALDGLTATRRLLGAYVRLGLPAVADADPMLRTLLFGAEGLLDRDALCRSVAAGESPLRVVWLDEEPRRRARALADLLAQAVEREAAVPSTLTAVDATVEQLRAALRIQQIRARLARG